MLPLLAALLFQPAPATPAQAETPAVLDWAGLESNLLADHVQLTFPAQFVRAGEAYFDHEDPPRWIIFQAIPVPPPGQDPSPHYSMFVAPLRRDEQGRVVGLEGEPLLVSAEGSANTCGWFHPRTKGRILFGSTLTPPQEAAPAGYSRDRSRYQWQFPSEMRVVARTISPIITDLAERTRKAGGRPSFVGWKREEGPAKPLFDLPDAAGYAAECSWSADGRQVLFTYRDPRTNNPDIWVYDSSTQKHTVLVNTHGYNGGPFFSPDGKAIIYRSDRRGDSQLQLFTASLAFGDGNDPLRITGLAHEFQLTDNEHVNWAPFYHPSGRFVVFATSEIGHDNYEVFALRLPDPERLAREPGNDWPAERAALTKVRVTSASGFDGLPVFNHTGDMLMWTSQRGPKLPSEQRPSSQLWLARFKPDHDWTP